VFLLFPLQFFTPFNDNARDVLFTVGVLAIATVASAVAAFLTWSLRTPEYRRMNRPIQLARIFSVAAAVVSGIIVVLTGSLAIIGFVGLAFLSLPLAYLYTIGRYRLLDLELRVRRNVQWGVLSVLWGAVAVLLFGVVLGGIADANFRLPRVTISGLSVEVLDTGNADPASPGPVRWVLLLSGILAFIVVRVVRKRGQVFINRRFYRQPTDYTRAVAALAEVLAKRLSLVDLGRGMVERLATVLRLKRAAVFFFRSDGACCCGETFGVEKEVWGEMRSITDRPFVETVTALTKVSRVDYLPPGLRDRLRSAGFHFLIPIRSQQLLIGAMILGEKQSEGNYSDGEIEFLSAAASQASVAIENAFLYEELAGKERLEHELQIARRIQLASLPQETPALAAFDIAGVSSPAMEVGGDFFDYLVDGDGRLTVVVGDVSGKGTSAALYMSKVQGILRSLHEFRLAPGDMFVRTNRLLAGDIDRSSFVTALCASFGAAAGNALLARAGHLPLYVFAAQSGSVSRVAPRGLGLALDENAKFAEQLEERTLAFARGDVFLFVTDGVTEARNEEGEEYGEERLVGLLQQEGRRTATEIRDALSAALRDFVGKADQHDDQTIVVVRATGV
jgi:serine phosphatase RsbU (regulator of sigma subunit)